MAQIATIAGVPVVKIGHGLMSMTTKPEPLSDDQCFESIIAGINAAPERKSVFEQWRVLWSTAPCNHQFRTPEQILHEVSRACRADFLVCQSELTKGPDMVEEGIARSINNIIEKLGPNKKIDLFQPARIDPEISIEETMTTLNKYVEYGKIGSIGLSECSEATLVRASKVGSIAAVEIEVSFWSYEKETRKVIAAAHKLGTVVAAYSPLGSGFLTGEVPQELPKGDLRNRFPRFQGEAFENNLNLVNALKQIAGRKNLTLAQLCLAWVCSLGPHVVPIPSSTRAERTLENLAAASVALTAEDHADINCAVELNPVSGTRYPESGMKLLWDRRNPINQFDNNAMYSIEGV
ncbi:Aldo kereductase [Rhizoctonia solani]|uniref:Aldo kereductase n=1 Tax=Rhizoctonia solani TaxID=456999 RepID=A0A8H7M6J9_9AGAM|nr:Aldo kereductase [Rhizoctonia solani]